MSGSVNRCRSCGTYVFSSRIASSIEEFMIVAERATVYNNTVCRQVCSNYKTASCHFELELKENGNYMCIHYDNNALIKKEEARENSENLAGDIY